MSKEDHEAVLVGVSTNNRIVLSITNGSYPPTTTSMRPDYARQIALHILMCIKDLEERHAPTETPPTGDSATK